MSNKNEASMQSKGPGIMKTPLGEFQIGKTLGEGSYGKVKLIINIKTGEKLAVKVIKRFIPANPETGNKGRGGKTFEQRILREANLTKFLNHRNIVPLKDCRITKSHFYLFHQFIDGGQLTDKIGRNGLKLDIAQHYFIQIIDAIGYCHSNFVVHRDIKVENIMIDKDDNVKIIDFGLANFFDQKNALKTFCGSLQYSAPEIMRGDPYIGPEVDIWSIGVVLFAMLTGTLPFDDPRNPGAWECVMNGKIKWPMNINPTAKSIITRLLDPIPKTRITMSDILKHPFVNNTNVDINDYKPSNYRNLPLKLDSGIITEMTACLFQSEHSILQQLEDEMKKGKLQDGYIIVNNSPLVSVYHLIANTKEKPKQSNNNNTNNNDVKPIEVKKPNPIVLPKQNKVELDMRRNVTDNHPGVIVDEQKDIKRVMSENGVINQAEEAPQQETEIKLVNMLSRRQAITESRRRRAQTVSENNNNNDNNNNENKELVNYNSDSTATWDKETYKQKRASMYETYRKMNEELRFELDSNSNSIKLSSEKRKQDYMNKRASLYEGFYNNDSNNEGSNNDSNNEGDSNEGSNNDDTINSTNVNEDIEIKIEDQLTKTNGNRKNSVKRRITIFKLNKKNTIKKKTSKLEMKKPNDLSSKEYLIKERLKNHLKQKHVDTVPVYERESSLKNKHENSIEIDDKSTNLFNKIKESPIETSRLKKQEKINNSPLQNEIRSPFLTTSPLLISPIAKNRVNIDKNAPKKNDDNMVLPIISNQKKYLDKLLEDYKNNVNDTSDDKIKKKVTFKEGDTPIDTPTEDSNTKIDDEIANKVKDIYNQLKQPIESSSDSEEEETTIKPNKFKSPKQKTEFIVDELANLEVQNKLNLNLTVNQLQHNISPSLPPLNVISKKQVDTHDDFIPGVRQVSITECLKSKVIKISKIDISQLSDTFLDKLSDNNIDYDWLEKAFFFKVLIPDSKLNLNNKHTITIHIELVQIKKAKSSAILLLDCDHVDGVDNNEVEKRVLKYLKELN